MPKSHTILIAHGSKDPRWRMPFEVILADLRAELGEGKVSLAYMEFATPDLLSVVNNLTNKGLDSFRILPLFMSSGAHVSKDIPAIVEDIKSKKTGLNFEILPAIGEHKLIVSMLKNIIVEAVNK